MIRNHKLKFDKKIYPFYTYSKGYIMTDDNKICMNELHDKFYELYDDLVERGVKFCDVSDEFHEIYSWFVHYGCQSDDLKRAQDLYDAMAN